MKSKNITLIGMSGSGKSTLGKMLATRYDYCFVDTDDVIVYQEGRKLQKIIDTDGDDILQYIEKRIILNLHGQEMVFSPGGSCVFSEQAMQHLKKISLVIFIDLPFDILLKRFEQLDASKRGIIGLTKYSFKELFELRQPLYQKYADLSLQIGEETVDESFKHLLEAIEKHESS